MNNSGSANDTSVTQEPEIENGGNSPRRSPSLLLVLLLILGLVLAIYIGTNVIGVLFGMVSPPLPPLPTGLTETNHINEAYGADVWTYASAEDGCSFVEFYQQFGVCTVAPFQCGELREPPNLSTGETTVTARCTGGQEFSIFNMKWWALISRLNTDGTTRIELEREVFWIGEGP